MKEKLTIKERIQALKPGQIIWPLIILLIVLGVGVGIYNYQQNLVANKVPTLTVKEPSDNTTVSDAQITTSGTVDPGDKVTINDKVIDVAKDGSYSATMDLAPGPNTVTIVATGQNGKSKIVTKQITREVPTPITTQGQVAGGQNPGTLAQSGPETDYPIAAGIISASIVAWTVTRKKLTKAQLKR